MERKTVLNPIDDARDKENADHPTDSSDLVIKTSSALSLVDLAGTESVCDIYALNKQKEESKMINQR